MYFVILIINTSSSPQLLERYNGNFGRFRLVHIIVFLVVLLVVAGFVVISLFICLFIIIVFLFLLFR